MSLIRKIMVVVCACAFFSSPSYGQLFDFELSDGGWVGTNDWAWGAPSGVDGSALGGFGATEPASGASGSNVWGTILGGLHSPGLVNSLNQTFDFTGVTDASLRFMEWSDSGSPEFDRAEVLVNGTQVYESDGDSMEDWRPIAVDLSAYDGLSSVDVEFRFTASASVERVGWYVDDVNITAVPEPMSFVMLFGGAIAACGLLRKRS